MDYVMSKYILTRCCEMIKQRGKKILFFSVHFVIYGDLKNQTQKPNLKQRKILFLNDSFTFNTFNINVYVLLHSPK